MADSPQPRKTKLFWNKASPSKSPETCSPCSSPRRCGWKQPTFLSEIVSRGEGLKLEPGSKTERTKDERQRSSLKQAISPRFGHRPLRLSDPAARKELRKSKKSLVKLGSGSSPLPALPSGFENHPLVSPRLKLKRVLPEGKQLGLMRQSSAPVKLFPQTAATESSGPFDGPQKGQVHVNFSPSVATSHTDRSPLAKQEVDYAVPPSPPLSQRDRNYVSSLSLSPRPKRVPPSLSRSTSSYSSAKVRDGASTISIQGRSGLKSHAFSREVESIPSHRPRAGSDAYNPPEPPAYLFENLMPQPLCHADLTNAAPEEPPPKLKKKGSKLSLLASPILQRVARKDDEQKRVQKQKERDDRVREKELRRIEKKTEKEHRKEEKEHKKEQKLKSKQITRAQLSSETEANGIAMYSNFIDIVLQHQGLLQALYSILPRAETDKVAKASALLFDHYDKALELLSATITNEVNNTGGESTLFRANSVASRLLVEFCMQEGGEYLRKTLRTLILGICHNENTQAYFEVNPSLLPPGADLEDNIANVIAASEMFISKIKGSAKDVPPRLKQVFHFLQSSVQRKYPNSAVTVVGGIFFLRFICPAIVSPEFYRIVPEVGEKARRALLLISKILQKLSNRAEFTGKEEYMMPFNVFVKSNFEVLEHFLNEISVHPGTVGTQKETRDVLDLSHVKVLQQQFLLNADQVFEQLSPQVQIEVWPDFELALNAETGQK